MKDKGRIILFTGDGKGKTTAALGMAVRASGHGLKTLVIQFVKSDQSTGEIAACRNVPGIEIVQTGRGFVPETSNPAFADHTRAAREGLELAAAGLSAGSYDLLVLDEVCTAVSKGLLTEAEVAGVIRNASPETVIVMTGRNAAQGLIVMADTVTEMRMVKHGFTEGYKAQKGVEY